MAIIPLVVLVFLHTICDLAASASMVEQFLVPIPKEIPHLSTMSPAHPDSPSAPDTLYTLTERHCSARIAITRKELAPLLDQQNSVCSLCLNLPLNPTVRCCVSPMECYVRCFSSASQFPLDQEDDSTAEFLFTSSEAVRTCVTNFPISLQQPPNPVEKALLSGLRTALLAPNTSNKIVDYHDPDCPDPFVNECRVSWVIANEIPLTVSIKDNGLLSVEASIVKKTQNLMSFVADPIHYNMCILDAQLRFTVNPLPQSFARK